MSAAAAGPVTRAFAAVKLGRSDSTVVPL